MGRINISQLHKVEELPKHISIHLNDDPKSRRSRYWDKRNHHLTPYYKKKYRHIRNAICKKTNLNYNQLLYKLYKIADNTVDISEIESLFELPDRNGEYSRYNEGWSGWYKSDVEFKVKIDGTLDYRVRKSTRNKLHLSHQEHYRLITEKRKNHKEIKFKPTGKSNQIQNLHKKDVKIKGYTKTERFNYMLSHNPISILINKGLIKMHGPLRKVKRLEEYNRKKHGWNIWKPKKERQYIITYEY